MRDRPSPTRARGHDPLVGLVIGGRFRIEARIGSGGMGSVYRAEQLGLDRQVALKILDPSQLEGTSVDSSQSSDDVAVLERRFSREASILARLAHPNVVTVFDYGRIDDVPEEAPGGVVRPRFYMAMELLGGETLQERLHKRKKLPPDEVIALARQIGRGLREAHALGIVHRDLKPANVMVVRDRDGEEVWKILDFGIGKIVDDDALPTSDSRAELTQQGRFVGSPMYMAPEQISHGDIDARADLYSFGVLLYRCLAGVHPFHKENTALVLLAHLQEAPAPLRDKATEVPEWLARIVHQCLEKDPERRPRAMEEILRALADGTRDGPHSSGSFGRASPLSASGALPVPSSLPAPQFAPEPSTFASGDLAAMKGSAHLRAPGMPIMTPGMTPLQSMGLEAQHTPHTTHRPATLGGDAPQTPRSWIAIGVFAFLVIAAGTALLARSSSTKTPAPVTTTPIATTFRLLIDSTPPGAEVREGARLHGQTPVEITIENESVQTAPRTFVVQASGYEPRTLTQGPSKEAVRLSLDLHPLPSSTTPSVTASAAPTEKPAGKATPKTVTKPTSAPTSAPPPPKSDIILER